MASGPFHIDSAEIKGNASLFEGSMLATGEASSKLRINGGARLEVAPDSQARVFARRAVLERGAGQLQGAAPYLLEARTLRITVPSAAGIARVQLDEGGAVLVSAVNGPVRVSNSTGVLVANLAAGRSLRFQPQAAASDAFEATGCLLKKQGRFIIVDQTTSQVFELRSGELNAELGNRVTVKGVSLSAAQPVAGAAQAISVRSVTQVAPGGCLATAASVGADPPPGATATGTAHESVGPNKAVIAGVIIAGGAAAGVAVALSNKSKSK